MVFSFFIHIYFYTSFISLSEFDIYFIYNLTYLVDRNHSIVLFIFMTAFLYLYICNTMNSILQKVQYNVYEAQH